MPGSIPKVESVLHVVTCLDIGGAELTLKKLVLADPAAATRHVVVSLRDIGPVGRELQNQGVVVHALGMDPRRANFAEFMALVRIIRRLRPDVIQTWLYHGDFFGGLAARLAGRREIIWGIRHTGFVPASTRTTVWIMRACALLSRFVPRVIVCCADSARLSHERWGYSAKRMRVIPNGFALPDLSQRQQWRHALRNEVGIGSEERVIGMVARFDPLKNHELFIKAAAAVAVRQPGVRFLLVGRGVDAGNVTLMRWIEESGVREHFVLLGERRDVDHCLAAMDVFSLTSTFEAFPNVVAEAMAMAVPCVVTDAGDASRIVGEAGWVVPVDDASKLGDTLVHVLEMGGDAREERGQAGRRRIEEFFSVDASRKQFERAYVDAMSPRRPDGLVQDN